MVRRRKWGRRRGDDRVSKKDDYALIQDVETTNSDEELSFPEPEPDPVQCENDSENTLETADSIQPVTPPSGPQVFAFIGATGGVGTTSLATQLAHEFAISKAQPRLGLRPADPNVCLIDLDFENGACAHHLDLLPSLTLQDLSGPADAIDEALTRALVSTHDSGICLLAAPNTIGAHHRVNPRTVMAILDAATELYDTVILDMPRHRQAWTLPVMQAVDMLGVVCELTVPSLHAAREMMGQLAHDATVPINAQPIIGKFERRAFKNMLKLGDAETALGRKAFATICQDPDTTREALNCGEPAGALKSDSRFVKDIREIAQKLQQSHSAQIEKAA